MSMPTWLNDVPPLPGSENEAFNTSIDPSVAFMQTPTTASFDFSQLQNPQLQQRMQNGNVRNGSPALHTPVYQTQPVIPTKRPRQESLGGSPRQNSGPPASRSQTPQQGPYPGFQGAVNGGPQFQGATPYPPSFQHASSNASLSPPLQNQQFNPQAVPQRVSTMSPSPFSPAVQNFGSRASPAHSEHGSRVNTPQNGASSYAQGMPYGSGPSQPFNPSLASNSAAPPPSQFGQPPQNIQQQQQQQRMYEIRQRQLMHQLQASNAAAVRQVNPSAMPPGQMPTNPMAARPLQAQQQMMRPSNPEQFVRNISQWMQGRGLQLNPNPTVTGRPINLMQLFAVVMKHGGSKRVTMASQWTNIASVLSIPPPQFMAAAQELQEYWHTNLSAYEHWWMQAQQQQAQQQQAQQRQRHEQMRMAQQMQGGDAAQDPFSPIRQANAQLHEQQAQHMMHAQAQVQAHAEAQAQAQAQAGYQTPVKQMTPQHPHAMQPEQNGYLTPQPGHISGRQANLYGVPQPGPSRQPRATPPQAQPQLRYPTQPANPVVKKEPYASANSNAANLLSRKVTPRIAPLGPLLEPKVENVTSKEHGLESHGGIQVRGIKGTIDDLLAAKPSVPPVRELGRIDIRALTLSLRSGIHAEVRLALDTLASLSNEQHPPSLENCEDLMETLIECADEQVELLAENAAEVSDVMLVDSYEETVRGCASESETLQDVPEFGTLEYDLDRSVDRLICITTILRNFSFFEFNHRQLTDPAVIRFLTTVIRYLGTRNMLLRTYTNTLDFSKDVVIYLSNVSQNIDLPEKEEALCILHFLLSFAPTPPPTTAVKDEIMFSPYSPSIHRYFPPAVDSLAKLLARDEPNRTFYRSIFLADSAALPPYELLTRTFGLAIAPLPDFDTQNIKSTMKPIIKARGPYLAQGLLAAEILVGLIPNTEHALPRSWLSSQDGFALTLVRIVTHLATLPPLQGHGHPQNVRTPETELYSMISERGVSVLRKLGEKAKDPDVPEVGLPTGVVPNKDILVQALLIPTVERNVLGQLCAYEGLNT